MKGSFIAKGNSALTFVLLPGVDASTGVLLQFMLMNQTSHFVVQVRTTIGCGHVFFQAPISFQFFLS
jgi:hypothetical protein